MDGRRTLGFSNLGEVMVEVDRLLPAHRTVGNWTLGQICNHLSGALTVAVDGVPVPVRVPWVVRKTIGALYARTIFKTGRFPGWVKLPEEHAPKPGLDARAEAEALRAAIRLFGSHVGPYADHPLVGPMDRRTWERFTCLHCAHHLGFVLPGDVTGA